MVTIADIKEHFSFLDNWEDRYRYLIELGGQLSPFPEDARHETNRVRGCISRVWLLAATEQTAPTKLTFLADSDAHIVKGLIAVLLAIYNHKTPTEILSIDLPNIFHDLGLEQHLSPNRRNGFFAMVEKIRQEAQRLANLPDPALDQHR